MRSLYLVILVAMVILLSLSTVVYFAISHAMEKSYFSLVLDAMDEVEVQEAQEILESRGPEAIIAYMHRLNTVFGGLHYLLDADGKDVLTGEDRSAVLPKPPLT